MLKMTHRVYHAEDDYGRLGLYVHVESDCAAEHLWSVAIPAEDRLQLKKDRPRFWYRYAENVLLANDKLRVVKLGKQIVLACKEC